MTERGASIRHRLVPKFANVPIAARLPGKHTTHLQANSFDIGADDAAAGFVTLARRELQILGTPKLAQIERSQPRGLDILFRPRNCRTSPIRTLERIDPTILLDVKAIGKLIFENPQIIIRITHELT